MNVGALENVLKLSLVTTGTILAKKKNRRKHVKNNVENIFKNFEKI